MGDYPSTRGERIEVAIKGTGLTKGDFAAALGLNRQTITRWCNSEEISESEIERVAKITGKQPAWLRYGITTSEQAAIDRFVEGYELGKIDALAPMEKAAEYLADVLEVAKRRPAPIPGDAQPPRQMRGGEEEQERVEPSNGNHNHHNGKQGKRA